MQHARKRNKAYWAMGDGTNGPSGASTHCTRERGRVRDAIRIYLCNYLTAGKIRHVVWATTAAVV